MQARRFFLTVLLAVVAILRPAFANDALSPLPGVPLPGLPSNEAFDPRLQEQRATQAGPAAAERAMQLVQSLETKIDAFRTDNRLAGAGRKLLGLLGFIVITWAILKNMLLKPGLPQLVADLIFPLVVIGLGLSAISGNLGGLIAATVEELAVALGSSRSDQAAAASRFLGNIGATLRSVWSSSPPWRVADLGASYVAALLLQLVAVAFVTLAGAIGLGVLFMGKLQLALACMLGPIMIPWLLWKPTEFLFSGWLTFLIRGGFILVAVYAIERIMSEAMANLSDIARSTDAGIDSAMMYGTIALMAMLFAFLMLKSAEIGAGIVSGSVVGFGGFSAISQGGTASAIKGMAGAGARAAGRGAARLTAPAREAAATLAAQGARAAGRAAWSGGQAAARAGRAAGNIASSYATGYLHGRGPLSAVQKAQQPARGTVARAAYVLGRKHSG